MNHTRKEIIITLAVNIVLPYLIYTLLIKHTGSLWALSAAAVVPLVDSLYSLIKSRKADVFSAFIFIGLILGAVAVLLGGDERFILLRESYVTGIMGVLFLLSLLFTRPLIYYFAERFTGHDANMDEKWRSLPRFRHTFRLLTAVWGVALVLEAAVKVGLVYTLSVPSFLAVSPIAGYGIVGLAIWWTVRYVKRVKRQASPSLQPSK
ncbi:VC0807 family protein [Paenibacillus sp. TH7-28]